MYFASGHLRTALFTLYEMQPRSCVQSKKSLSTSTRLRRRTESAYEGSYLGDTEVDCLRKVLVLQNLPIGRSSSWSEFFRWCNGHNQAQRGQAIHLGTSGCFAIVPRGLPYLCLRQHALLHDTVTFPLSLCINLALNAGNLIIESETFL